MVRPTAHTPQTVLLNVHRLRQAGDETGRIGQSGLMVVVLLRLTTTLRADFTSITEKVKGISVLRVTDSHSRPPGP